MPPWFMALIFGSLGAIAAWSISRDLATGIASDDLYRFDRDENLLGYCALLAGKGFVVFFGIGKILFALGLMDDPFLMLKAIFG